MEEAKKMKCHRRLIYKQFVQVSGLCGPQFLSYLPKRFTHLCRALYGDAILVYRFGAPIWPPEINKSIWISLFTSAEREVKDSLSSGMFQSRCNFGIVASRNLRVLLFVSGFSVSGRKRIIMRKYYFWKK